MENSYIESHIQRTNKRLLIANLIIFLPFLSSFTDLPFSEMFRYLLIFPFAIVTLPLFILSGWNLFKWGMRKKKRESHPIIKKIASYGDVTTLSMSIEKEIKADNPKYYAATLTPSWYLNSTFFRLDIIKLDSLAWAYEKVQTKYSHGVKSQTNCFVVMHSKDGTSYDAPMSGEQIADFLRRLVTSSPGIVIGFSETLNQLWQKDRAAFLRNVAKNGNGIQQTEIRTVW